MPRTKGQYTPTEFRILALLSDGEFHSRDQMRECLYDNMSGDQALVQQLSMLRKKLPDDQKILPESVEIAGKVIRGHRLVRVCYGTYQPQANHLS